MSSAADGRHVQDSPDEDRYVITVDGRTAGFARYVRRGGRTILVHTEVDPDFEGQGLGSALAAGALDAERSAGRPVVPLCPFIAAYIDRHPDYAELVDEELLARIDGD
jgi:uncharacterized protein